MKILPTRTESGSERDGFLSTYAEWHGTGIGAVLGVVTGATKSKFAFAMSMLVIMGRFKSTNKHLRDAAKESGYTAGAFLIGFATTRIMKEQN